MARNLLELLTGGSDPWAGLRQASQQPQQMAGGEYERPQMQAPPQAAAPQSQPAQGGGGGGMADFFSALGPAIAMLDPRNQQLGMALMQVNQGRQKERKEQKSRNETVSWLAQMGVGTPEAEFLAKTPEALSAWYKSYKTSGVPDWQIKRLINDQGEEQDFMVDMKSGNKSPLGGSMGRKPTNLMQNLEAAGLQPGTPEYQKAVLEGTRSGVNVDARQMGNIPPGYQVQYDDQNRPVSMAPIPGSPAALEAQQAQDKIGAKADSQSIKSDIVTNAAENARKLIGNFTTGTPGRILSNILSEGDAAALRRQVDVLKSNATIESLNAMRQQSPTGGALGNVTEKEGAMLAAAAGALDPNAGPTEFKNALDNYERAMLRIIHGPAEGDRIFGSRGNQQNSGQDDPLGIR